MSALLPVQETVTTPVVTAPELRYWYASHSTSFWVLGPNEKEVGAGALVPSAVVHLRVTLSVEVVDTFLTIT